MISDEQLNAETTTQENGNGSIDITPTAESTAEAATENVEAVAEQSTEESELNASSEVLATSREPLKSRAPKERRDRKRQDRPKRQTSAMFRRFVSIVWSGRREPVDDMYWVEAEREGDWIVIREFEQVRSRKEILDRLQELPSGLVAVDFNLSYPQNFIESVKSETGIADWRGLAKKVREDLKKNADDGVRLWVERMGRYREANLDPEPPRFARREPDRRDRFSNDRRDRFSNDRFAGERREERSVDRLDRKRSVGPWNGNADDVRRLVRFD